MAAADGGGTKIELDLARVLDRIERSIETGLADIRARLDSKADKAAVEGLSRAVSGLSGEVEGLKLAEHDDELRAAWKAELAGRQWTRREKVWGLGAATVGIFGTWTIAIADLLTRAHH